MWCASTSRHAPNPTVNILRTKLPTSSGPASVPSWIKCSLLCQHLLHKPAVVNGPRAVWVRIAHHFVCLARRQLFPQVRHEMAELGSPQDALALAVKDTKGIQQLLLA